MVDPIDQKFLRLMETKILYKILNKFSILFGRVRPRREGIGGMCCRESIKRKWIINDTYAERVYRYWRSNDLLIFFI